MKFIILFFLCALATFSIYPLTNLYLDKYGIFQSPVNACVKVFNEPNKNFLKARFVINNKNTFDSFVFGSSRLGKIDVTMIPGGKYYNMNYSEGVPAEHLENIQLFLNAGVKIKNIVIGLDDFSCMVDPAKHTNEPMRLAYFGTKYNQKNRFEHYWYYLFLKIQPIDFPRSLQKEVIELFLTGASRSSETYEQSIDSDIENYIKDPKFQNPIIYSGDRCDQTIDEIQEIVLLAHENDINLIFFINPIHHVTYLNNNFAVFMKFKKMLSRVTDYYDFSGLNSITTNNGNYYETSHYRQRIGDLIIDHMFNNKEKHGDGFGQYVTKDNFALHAELLKSQVNGQDFSKVEKTSNNPLPFLPMLLEQKSPI